MEPVLIAAYREMLPGYTKGCLVDRILEDPDYRSAFLARARAAGVAESEYDILHGLHNLRKKSKLPRRDGTPAPTA